MKHDFLDRWVCKIGRVRRSHFWHHISNPPSHKLTSSLVKPGVGEVGIDNTWAIVTKGEISNDGPAYIGINDLKQLLFSNFGVRLRPHADRHDNNIPRIVFELICSSLRADASRWGRSFELNVSKKGVVIRANSEQSLLQGSLYLSNYWRLRRNLFLPRGKKIVKAAVEIHMGADFWGGFNTTQAWIQGRESDTNFIELARMGINAMPVMALLEDYIDTAPKQFRSLINPQAKFNRSRLAQLARQSSKYGIDIFLVAYNPKLNPKHDVFRHSPHSKGALQHNDAFRVLCCSDNATRKFLVDSWGSLFGAIPELGGMLALVGGEGFYHCFMRSTKPDAGDCPRCSKKAGSDVVAEFINNVADNIRVKNKDARVFAWPYSATHWSHDRDQVDFIKQLDPANVTFQTEIDKDSVDWRVAGYGKYCWDYSASRVTASQRCLNQRKQCRKRGVSFSCKLEINNSIECLSVPYLPTLQNQLAVWENCRSLAPQAIHSRWLFDGACKSPSEELGYWAVWGMQSEFKDLHLVLESLAVRDFGPSASKYILTAWNYFSRSMRHHPCLDYYVGPYFIGPGQPLVIDTQSLPASPESSSDWEVHKLKFTWPAQKLDPAFFGHFYWLWEADKTDDDTHFVNKQSLFYYQPGFRAIVRRGAKVGQDVALQELRAMAALWERGIEQLKKARAHIPVNCRERFLQEWIIAQHLGYTWQSAANVEEFLRLRDRIIEFSSSYSLRSGHARENIRDMDRITKIAKEELDIAHKELALIKGIDFLDLSLRLDMGAASLEEIMEAKINQVTSILKEELPAWRKLLLKW